MDQSMLEKDALVALLEKLKELASQERGEGELLESAADDLEGALPGAEPEMEVEEEEVESLPLFAADQKPPMRKRVGTMMGASEAPPAMAKKGFKK